EYDRRGRRRRLRQRLKASPCGKIGGHPPGSLLQHEPPSCPVVGWEGGSCVSGAVLALELSPSLTNLPVAQTPLRTHEQHEGCPHTDHQDCWGCDDCQHHCRRCCQEQYRAACTCHSSPYR